MADCAKCAVRGRSICSNLSQPELEDIGRLGHHKILKRGETLIWEGDDSLLVGNVIRGLLKLTISTCDGADQILGIAYAGDFIGRPFGAKSGQTVTAMTDAEVCLMRRSDFDASARRFPKLQNALLQRALSDLDHARQWMLLLGRKSAPERVSSFLLEMADHMATDDDARGKPGNLRFDIPFGRQEIADVLGLTIETVSRQMTKLRREGTIHTVGNRSIEILDLGAMEVCSGN